MHVGQVQKEVASLATPELLPDPPDELLEPPPEDPPDPLVDDNPPLDDEDPPLVEEDPPLEEDEPPLPLLDVVPVQATRQCDAVQASRASPSSRSPS